MVGRLSEAPTQALRGGPLCLSVAMAKPLYLKPLSLLLEGATGQVEKEGRATRKWLLLQKAERAGRAGRPGFAQAAGVAQGGLMAAVSYRPGP